MQNYQMRLKMFLDDSMKDKVQNKKRGETNNGKNNPKKTNSHIN